MSTVINRFRLAPLALALALFLTLGLAGCEEDSALEDAAEDVSDSMESAGDEVEDKAEDIRDNAEEAADEADDEF